MKNNNKLILFCRIVGVACMLALFSCFIGTRACAAESAAAVPPEAAVVSSRTADDAVYIYIKGVGDITSGTTVQVGNTLCGDIQAASVVSMGLPVKTTILFDNSLSLSKRWGSQAKELVEGLIDSHAEGEEFRIATFADGLNVIADFSTDYESLKAGVGEIEFLNQDSYLTDILHDLLKQGGDSGEAGYMRFIIITDGADDQEIKYTQAELSDLMKNSGVVIHTVGVKVSNNNNLLENLFSYARLTGGTYSIAEGSTDVESVKNLIDEDYSILCLRVAPEAGIMDGGRKEAKLALNTPQGEVVLTASLKMPFGNVNSVPEESASESAEPSPLPAAEPEKPELPSIVVQPPAGEAAAAEGKQGILPAIVIGAVFLACIAALALLLLNGRKKKQIDVVITNNEQPGGGAQNHGQQMPSMQQMSPGQQMPLMQQGTPAQPGGNTVRLGSQAGAEAGGNTVRLQGGTGQPMARQSFITLTDINNPQRSFRVPINTRIVIGRGSGDIILGFDAAVSHTHCEIVKKGNLFYVNDLKSSNGTFYGGMRVCSETPVMNGGILEVGMGKYKITIES